MNLIKVVKTKTDGFISFQWSSLLFGDMSRIERNYQNYENCENLQNSQKEISRQFRSAVHETASKFQSPLS